MTRPRTLLGVALFAWSVACPQSLPAQTKEAAPLTLEDVVQLHKAGLSDEVIVTKIRKGAKAFDLNAGELLELKANGISETILKYLLDPALPYTTPPPPPAPQPGTAPPPPPAPTRKFPADAHASRIPTDPGLYRVEGESVGKIDVKSLLGTKESAGLGKVLLKKEKVTAYLVPAKSKTRIRESAPVFYLRLAEGKLIEDIVLAAMAVKKDRRELEMGPPAPKQELKAEVIRQFDALEVGPQLFRLTTPGIKPGEYLFLQMGSAEPPKGSYGKGFDFGVEGQESTKGRKH